MTNQESPSPEDLVAEIKVSDEVRLTAIKTQLDQLFRQAGNGAETRALYRTLLDFRMDKHK